MGFKNLTVNNISSDDFGLSDTITINNPLDGQVLQKKTSDWGGLGLSFSSDSKISYLTISDPGNINYIYQVGHNLSYRKASGTMTAENITFETAGGSYSPFSNDKWTAGWELDGTFFNGKTVLLYAVPSPYRYVGSTTSFQWGIGLGSLSSWTPIGPRAFSNDTYGAPCFGIYNGTGTTETLTIKLVERYGNAAITNGAVASVGQVIMKVIEE